MWISGKEVFLAEEQPVQKPHASAFEDHQEDQSGQDRQCWGEGSGRRKAPSERTPGATGRTWLLLWLKGIVLQKQLCVGEQE